MLETTMNDPYRCNLCSKGFDSIESLQVHARNHGTEFSSRKRARITRGRVSQACHMCAAAKVKCDEEIVCHRCQKKGIHCVRSMSMSVNSNSASADTSVRLPPSSAPSEESNLDLDLPVLLPIYGAQRSLGEDDSTAKESSIEHLPSIPYFESDVSTINPDAGSTDLLFEDFLSAIFHESASSYPDIERQSVPDQGLFTAHSNMDLEQEAGSAPIRRTRDRRPQEQPHLTNNLHDVQAENETSLAARVAAFDVSVWNCLPDPAANPAAPCDPMQIPQSAANKLNDYAAKLGPHTDDLISGHTRDALLAFMTGICKPHDFSRFAASFPSRASLQSLLTIFLFEHSSQLLGWIHTSSVSTGAGSPLLLATMIAYGATISSISAVRDLGYAMYDALHGVYARELVAKSHLSRQLCFLQGLALLLEMATLSGDRSKSEFAESFWAVLIAILRRSNRFQSSLYKTDPPCLEDDGEVLQSKWQQWVGKESFKRLVYRAYLLSNDFLAVLAAPPMVLTSELRLPLPVSKALWTAKTAYHWKEKYLCLSHSDTLGSVSLVEYLALPSDKFLKGMYDEEVARHFRLYSIWPRIGELRQLLAGLSSIDIHGSRSELFMLEYLQLKISEHLRQCSLMDACLDHAHRELNAVILEYMYLQMHVSMDEILAAAGKHGEDEARLAYPRVCQWFRGCQSRQASYHAAQLIKLARAIPVRMTAFLVLAIFHATSVLYMYGIMVNAQSYNTTKERIVPIDESDSVEVQMWIKLGRGSPSIKGARSGGQTLALKVPLDRPSSVMAAGLQIILDKHTESDSPWYSLNDNITNLMRGLVNAAQAVGL